jgi:hypothetical protein
MYQIAYKIGSIASMVSVEIEGEPNCGRPNDIRHFHPSHISQIYMPPTKDGDQLAANLSDTNKGIDETEDMSRRPLNARRKLLNALPNIFVFIITFTHVLLSPYTKVEESFTLHAVHDALAYGPFDLSKVEAYHIIEYSGIMSHSQELFQEVSFPHCSSPRRPTQS